VSDYNIIHVKLSAARLLSDLLKCDRRSLVRRMALSTYCRAYTWWIP